MKRGTILVVILLLFTASFLTACASDSDENIAGEATGVSLGDLFARRSRLEGDEKTAESSSREESTEKGSSTSGSSGGSGGGAIRSLEAPRGPHDRSRRSRLRRAIPRCRRLRLFAQTLRRGRPYQRHRACHGGALSELRTRPVNLPGCGSPEWPL